MKKTVFLLIILLSISTAAQAGIGSFLILKSVYFFNTSEKTGPKELTRKRIAYDVEAIKNNQAGEMMFQLAIPGKDNPTNGSGYIMENEEELKKLADQLIRVFPELPTVKSDLTKYHLVPSKQLLFSGKRKVSKDFPYLEWREVNYKAYIARQLWVADWSGIYRPDKDSKWLNKAYEEVQKADFSSDVSQKILSGVIENGFTEQMVRIALGEPTKKEKTDDGSAVEWFYFDRKVIFKNAKVFRIL